MAMKGWKASQVAMSVLDHVNISVQVGSVLFFLGTVPHVIVIITIVDSNYTKYNWREHSTYHPIPT